MAALNLSRRELARLLTRIENHTADSELAALYPQTGHAHIIGITGSPGVGKSSLVNALALHYRSQQLTVAILAVDPTSPFSGGAILGDRIRMRDLSGDPGVFIRSMATRGALGGLAATTADLSRALDAAGFDRVLVETVGAGQSEIDIARAAQTTIVLEAPGMGDDIQAIKAGILEIADILVVNKADHPGLESVLKALRAMLELGSHSDWQPPIVQTVATNRQGLADLAVQIDAHRTYLQTSGEGVRRSRAQIAIELEIRLREAIMARLHERRDPAQTAALIDQVVAHALDPAAAVNELLRLLPF